MNSKRIISAISSTILSAFLLSCSNTNHNQPMLDSTKVNIVFLHHSTGDAIWKGSVSKYVYKFFKRGDVSKWFKNYNKSNYTNYQIESISFPKEEEYGWKNYPFDYYNIWVKNSGNELYKNEPTLEILTKKYNVIIWKHCYPVGNILHDTGVPDINSEEKRIENYKLQYNALKAKMLQFPDTKFIVWTGAALTKSRTNESDARAVKDFFNWVKNTWDEPGDNIFIWDFLELETEGGLYLKDDYASGPDDPHPVKSFAHKVAPLFCNRIIEVIQNRGDNSSLTGE
ncbi:MAG: hypothetical protein JXJ22_17075 [Bacteroidales bacterium]|nr:hypothetical protein [Bacteroidales bacterium]